MPPGAEVTNPEDVWVDPGSGEEAITFDPNAITLADFQAKNADSDETAPVPDSEPTVTVAESAREFVNGPKREQRFGGSVLEILMEKGDFTFAA
jgi:hypothetical protein